MFHYELSICKHVYSSGVKKGKMCRDHQCSLHDEYDMNIGKFLGLPDDINYSYKIKKDTHFKLINMYKILDQSNGIMTKDVFFKINMLLLENNNDIDNILYCMVYMLDKIQNCRHVNSKKVLYIYLMVIIDFILINNISLLSEKSMILENIIITYQDDIPYIKYINENFVNGKRFFSIKKNFEYKRRMFKIYMKVVVFANKWFYDMIDVRYAPGGTGYIEAFKDFNLQMDSLDEVITNEVNPSLQIQTPRPKSTSVEEEVVILQEESVKVVKNPLVDNTIYEEEDDDSNEEDDEADKESYRSWDDLCDYRSNGEKSTEYEGSESEGEEEYSGYDEYYESGADGGYWLYGDHYLMTIPGYALFCEDQATTDRGELNCLWKELKKDNHSKYHEYIQKHKEQDPVGFYKFRRHQTNLDRCLYPKKIKVVNVL